MKSNMWLEKEGLARFGGLKTKKQAICMPWKKCPKLCIFILIKNSHQEKFRIREQRKRITHKSKAQIYCEYEAGLPR